MNYMSQYCICNDRIEVEEIQEVLEDILDEEFDTVCEDDSPKGNLKSEGPCSILIDFYRDC